MHAKDWRWSPPTRTPALLRRWYLRNRLRDFEHLEESQVDWTEMVIGALSRFAAGDPNVLGELHDEQEAAALLLATALCDPAVAEAAWAYHRRESLEPAAVAGFAELLVERVDGPAAMGARWLSAKAFDHLGQPLDAERHLEAAVREGGDRFPLAARALAALVADRGDALRAARLLADSGIDEDDPLLEEIAPLAMHRPRGTTARNAPCPCGSGRKYKHCHLGADEQHTLQDRASWLYTKALRYVRNNRFDDILSDIALTINAASGRGEEFRRMIAKSELAADLALCEGGVLQPFITERRLLLPHDEAALADIWTLVERSVFEVETVGEDSLHLRDIRRGEHITITNTQPDNRTRPGTYLLGRPLPVVDSYRAFSGFIPIPAMFLNDALAATDRADLDEVAKLVGRCLALPVILLPAPAREPRRAPGARRVHSSTRTALARRCHPRPRRAHTPTSRPGPRRTDHPATAAADLPRNRRTRHHEPHPSTRRAGAARLTPTPRGPQHLAGTLITLPEMAPARSRPNLTIRGDVLVDRVLLHGRRAVRVRTATGEEIEAAEVIVSAGAIHAPAVRRWLRRRYVRSGTPRSPWLPPRCTCRHRQGSRAAA